MSIFMPVTDAVIEEATAECSFVSVNRPGTCGVKMRKPIRFKGKWCIRNCGRIPLTSYRRLNIGDGDVLIFHWDVSPNGER